jgi:glucarate dehydratase
VRLDREKVGCYAEMYQSLGGYPYDRDPGRPGWFALVPNQSWADPGVSLSPSLTPGEASGED